MDRPFNFLSSDNMHASNSYILLGTCIVGYLTLVQSMRWRRYNELHRKYQAKFESKTLTPEEAQQVLLVSSAYDMPLLLNYALAFALFKTYGIPSISKILSITKEFSDPDLVSKRYADTEILISTWVGCPISGFTYNPHGASEAEADPRAMIALARVNWLHSRFNISNGDFVYTLCLFALEPPKWAERYGWRSLSPLESYAFYVFWAEIGRRMGMKDIPEGVEEMKAWSAEYERKHMVPAESNSIIAEYTKYELLYPVPRMFGIRKFVERILICLLEEPVRIAMMNPPQPRALHLLTKSTLYTAAFVQRWFMLPRRLGSPRFPVQMGLPKATNTCPRMIPNKWQARPWYKPPRTGVGLYIDCLLVRLGIHTELPGPHLKSDGYRIEEMGPSRLENAGQEEVMMKAAELLGHPITGPFALNGGF